MLSALTRQLTRHAPRAMSRGSTKMSASLHPLGVSTFTRSGAVQQQQARGFAVEALKKEDDLRAVVGSHKGLITVQYTATWCGPCQRIAPVLEELSEVHDSVKFIKVDIDEFPQLASEAQVQAVPTFHLVKDNELVTQLQGADADALSVLIAEHAGAAAGAEEGKKE